MDEDAAREQGPGGIVRFGKKDVKRFEDWLESHETRHTKARIKLGEMRASGWLAAQYPALAARMDARLGAMTASGSSTVRWSEQVLQEDEEVLVGL